MIIIAMLYFIAGVLAASFVWAVLFFAITFRGPVVVIERVLRRLRLARLTNTSLDAIIDELTVIHRRLDKARKWDTK